MLASARKVLRIHTEDSDGGFPRPPALGLNKQGSERKRGPRMGSYKHLCLPDVALCVILCACMGVWVQEYIKRPEVNVRYCSLGTFYLV